MCAVHVIFAYYVEIAEGQYFPWRRKAPTAECQTRGGVIVWLNAYYMPNCVLHALKLLITETNLWLPGAQSSYVT